MIRSRFVRTVVASAALVAASLPWTASGAWAQTKPLTISGSGVAPLGLPLPGQPPRPHWAIGEASHLGRYYSEGSIQTDSATIDPGTGTIVGEFQSGSPLTFVAANGDKLVLRTAAPGTFVLTILGVTESGGIIVQGWFSASFATVPGLSTGRFAGAAATWNMTAVTEPFVLGTPDPVAFSWQGTGALTFSKP